MTSRQLFFGSAFFLWGVVCLLCNRLLVEEGQRWQGALSRFPGHIRIGPLAGRIFIITGGLVSLGLGILLLSGIIK